MKSDCINEELTISGLIERSGSSPGDNMFFVPVSLLLKKTTNAIWNSGNFKLVYKLGIIYYIIPSYQYNSQ